MSVIPDPAALLPEGPPRSPFGAMGCWNFGGDYWRKQSREVHRKTLLAALESGITHFDTAPAYGNGESEQLLGQLLKKELLKKNPETRKRLTVSTKFFPTLPENVRKGLKRSLGRLLLDYIDIYYIHWPNEKCDMAGIMGELEIAREEGLIRSIGVSNFSVKQMEEVMKYGKPDYCQTGYSLLWRYPEEGVLPWCRREGIKAVAYSPLAQGLLKDRRAGEAPGKTETGTATTRTPLFPWDDPRRQLIFFRNERELEQLLSRLTAASGAHKIPLAEAALSWLAEGGKIDGILTGFRTPEQAAVLGKVTSSTSPRLLRTGGKAGRALPGVLPGSENRRSRD